jgi:hypothetical protein
LWVPANATLPRRQHQGFHFPLGENGSRIGPSYTSFNNGLSSICSKTEEFLYGAEDGKIFPKSGSQDIGGIDLLLTGKQIFCFFFRRVDRITRSVGLYVTCCDRSYQAAKLILPTAVLLSG